jgi:hypothetical protein
MAKKRSLRVKGFGEHEKHTKKKAKKSMHHKRMKHK